MASFYSGDDVGAVVLDIGAGATKMGWAGDDYPKSYFRSNVAVSRNESGRIDKLKYDYYSRPIDGGDDKWEPCNPVDINTGLLYDPQVSLNANEVEKALPDWYDLMHKFVEHGYNTALRASKAEDHPLLLIERSYNPPATRQLTLECLFEELNVPAAFLSKDAVLSCYGCGRTSSTVIDVGYSGTTVVPVYDGYVEAKGIRRNPAASLHHLDQIILENLDKLYMKKKKKEHKTQIPPYYQAKGFELRKPSMHNAARLYMAHECRLQGAGASINTAVTTTTTTTTFHAPSTPYELPDGTVVDVPSSDRFRAADVLFGTSAAALDITAVQTTISEYIEAAAAQENDGEEGEDCKQLANEAVGLVGRKREKTKKRSAAAWQRACNPHLQTLLDQQLTNTPVAAMVCDGVYRCDRDQQATLLGNVVLCGGGACLGPTENGVPDHVKASIEAIIHQHTPNWRVKVLAPSLPERAVLPWIGGSILGSLGTFHDLWISRAEYDEWGSAIVNRKCP